MKKKLKKAANEVVAAPPKPRAVTVQFVLFSSESARRFDPANYMCLENVGVVKVTVKCDRGTSESQSVVTVHYRTVADTAQEHSDFVPTEGVLTFSPGQDT